MRLEHVRAFVVLAEELNFRRAAARLYVSQPTLSAQINGLERDLGVVLFERGRDGTRLTDDGATLVPLALQALRTLDALEAAARSPDDGTAHQLRLGVAPEGLGPATWATVRRLTTARPEVDVSMRPVGFGTMLSALEEGRVDAVVLHGPVDAVAGRVVETVGEVRVGVLLPRSHPLAGLDAVPLGAVVPLLRALPPSGVGQAFVDFWLVRDHPQAPVPVELALGEDSPTMARTAGRLGVVVLWPRDVPVPTGSGAVVRPLVEERWAPLQVVYRTGLALGPVLALQAVAAVAATTEPGVVRLPVLPRADRR